MNTKVLILISFFFTSLAYAHPNHMSFKNVTHDKSKIHNLPVDSKVLKLNSMDEKHGQDGIVPCTEQHQMTPCKKD